MNKKIIGLFIFVNILLSNTPIMAKNTKITIVACTNRKNSLTQSVADYYAELLRAKGCVPRMLKLTDLPADFTVSALYENKGKNVAFNRLQEVINDSEKFVFIIPEYNGSFPGVFKAFIDGLAFPESFKGKKCALVGVSRGRQGGVYSLSHLTDVFHYLGMHVYLLKPKLANITDGKLSTVKKNKLYVQLLDEQATGFIDF